VAEGEIADRKDVGVTKAEEEVDVGGPRADPFTAVSCARASSAGNVASASMSSPSIAAVASARMVRILAAERPAVRRTSSLASFIARGEKSGNAAVRRVQIASALAIESCCPTIARASPTKP